ncbi:MAG TPA: diacylglycerol kinase family protein [Candidatus Limnocylindrales bacterium]|nr:diacylglycerol kinase family protein [Candidatus Limnocylindrales bacterium]
MRATLIHSPSAGDAELDETALTRMLEEAGFQVRYRLRKGDWKKGLRDPEKSDLVVAAGGDGTVTRVALEMAGADIPIAILPLGTANNIARSLGLVGSAPEISARWKESQPRPLDVGVVRATWEEYRFVESAGGGLFAELIRSVDHDDSLRLMTGAKGDRALALLEDHVEAARPSRWEVDLDGEDLSGDYIAVEAMNTPFIGPKIPLAPEADPGDGQLELVLLGEQERGALLEYIGGRLREAAAELPDLPVRRGRHVHLRSVEGLTVHVGDEVIEPPRGHSPDGPYDIVLEPGAVLMRG